MSGQPKYDLASEVWTLEHGGESSCFRVVSTPKHQAFATVVYKMSNDERSPVCEARAQLIVTAPELLKLAKQYASECAECDGKGEVELSSRSGAQTKTEPCEACADICAVIARAEGRG